MEFWKYVGAPPEEEEKGELADRGDRENERACVAPATSFASWDVCWGSLATGACGRIGRDIMLREAMAWHV